MTQILIRNLPAGIKEALRERATQNSRSMEAEARQILTDVVIGSSTGIILEWINTANEDEDFELQLPARGDSRKVETF